MAVRKIGKWLVIRKKGKLARSIRKNGRKQVIRKIGKIGKSKLSGK